MKKRPKNVSKSRNFLNFIFSILNTVLFGQVTPKPNQKHYLDPIGVLVSPDPDRRKNLDPFGSDKIFSKLLDWNIYKIDRMSEGTISVTGLKGFWIWLLQVRIRFSTLIF